MKVRHLLNHTPVEIGIPDGYMLNLDYNQIIHPLNGLDQFLIYDIHTNRWVTPTEYGFTHNGIRYTNSDKPLIIGDLWIVVEKIPGHVVEKRSLVL